MNIMYFILQHIIINFRHPLIQAVWKVSYIPLLFSRNIFFSSFTDNSAFYTAQSKFDFLSSNGICFSSKKRKKISLVFFIYIFIFETKSIERNLDAAHDDLFCISYWCSLPIISPLLIYHFELVLSYCRWTSIPFFMLFFFSRIMI